MRAQTSKYNTKHKKTQWEILALARMCKELTINLNNQSVQQLQVQEMLQWSIHLITTVTMTVL